LLKRLTQQKFHSKMGQLGLLVAGMSGSPSHALT
jgi:hypothetical protein